MARGLLCPYCGAVSPNVKSCLACGGLFEPLSRQATQNSMGPWFIRDDQKPFMPGCSYEVIRALVRKGKIGPDTIIRGPTTNQFWAFARRAPGVAHLLGLCHACATRVPADATRCASCDAQFAHTADRQSLGLGPVREVPSKPAAPKPATPIDSDRPPEHNHKGQAGIAGLVILLILTTGGLAWAGYAALRWTESSSTAKALPTNQDDVAAGVAQRPTGPIQHPPNTDSIAVSPDDEAYPTLEPQTPTLASQAPSDHAEENEAPVNASASLDEASAEPMHGTDTDSEPEASADPADTIQTLSQSHPESEDSTAVEAVVGSAVSPVDAATMWMEEAAAAPQSVELVLDDRTIIVERGQFLSITRPVSAYMRLFAPR